LKAIYEGILFRLFDAKTGLALFFYGSSTH
jgi:hypothetical protein